MCSPLPHSSPRDLVYLDCARLRGQKPPVQYRTVLLLFPKSPTSSRGARWMMMVRDGSLQHKCTHRVLVCEAHAFVRRQTRSLRRCGWRRRGVGLGHTALRRRAVALQAAETLTVAHLGRHAQRNSKCWRVQSNCRLRPAPRNVVGTNSLCRCSGVRAASRGRAVKICSFVSCYCSSCSSRAHTPCVKEIWLRSSPWSRPSASSKRICQTLARTQNTVCIKATGRTFT